MKVFVIATAAVLLGAPTIALAQGSGGYQERGSRSGDRDWSRGSDNQSSSRSQNVPREIRRKLEAQGYTNIRVAPGSYVVNARDEDGDRVLMLFGPHSVTMIRGFSGDTQGQRSSGKNQKSRMDQDDE